LESPNGYQRGQVINEPFNGASFLLEHKLGKGILVNLSAMPVGSDGNKILLKLFKHYLKVAEVTLSFETTPGTIIIPRVKGDTRLWVVINMNGAGGTVELSEMGKDLVSDCEIKAGSLQVEPYGYRLIELDEISRLSLVHEEELP